MDWRNYAAHRSPVARQSLLREAGNSGTDDKGDQVTMPEPALGGVS